MTHSLCCQRRIQGRTVAACMHFVATLVLRKSVSDRLIRVWTVHPRNVEDHEGGVHSWGDLLLSGI